MFSELDICFGLRQPNSNQGGHNNGIAQVCRFLQLLEELNSGPGLGCESLRQLKSQALTGLMGGLKDPPEFWHEFAARNENANAIL